MCESNYTTDSEQYTAEMPSAIDNEFNGINGVEMGVKSPPILKGTVKHDPDFNVRNIMITGGAGFM